MPNLDPTYNRLILATLVTVPIPAYKYIKEKQKSQSNTESKFQSVVDEIGAYSFAAAVGIGASYWVDGAYALFRLGAKLAR